MKPISYFLLAILISQQGIAQEKKQPFFALLSSIKNSSESSLKRIFIRQELEISTMSDDPKGNKEKEKKRLQNFKSNEPCIKAYTEVKNSADKLITQLKADLTISNKTKLLRSLNNGINETNTWYKNTLEELQKKYTTLYNCTEGLQLAASLEEITGLFSALVGVVTSARDFRALQIKTLCEQLDTLRLKEFNELTSPPVSTESKDKEEK